MQYLELIWGLENVIVCQCYYRLFCVHGCYFLWVTNAFYCVLKISTVLVTHTCTFLQFWQTAYMLAMSVLSLASLFAQVHPKFLSNHWYMRRLFLYAALVFAGIVPVLHWVLDNGGFSDPLVQVKK